MEKEKIDRVKRIRLDSPTTIELKKSVTRQIDTLTIDRIIDYPLESRLSVLIKEVGVVVIAEGDEYSNLGDLTRDQVYSMVLKMYGVESAPDQRGDEGK